MNRLCMGCMREYDDRYAICPYCGYIFNTPPEQGYHMTPGFILNNRYIVGKVLGFGGFGVTYIGWDYTMARKVAIKEYLPSEFATRIPAQEKVTVYSGDREKGFREGLEKMMNEARRLAKFDAEPGIVQIYDCFEANNTSYIVMEYLDGITLKEYLEKYGKMTADQAIPVILQIASAMDVVHRAGILHRDIAPDNIYVLNPDEPDGLWVKLLDFGAARYATSKHSKSLSVIIKQGYAPEEQYSSRGDQGTWSDVYALAATLYKMLTGITPEDAMERGSEDEVKKPSKLGVSLSKSMETALMNAMNVKAQDRTQTMKEFMEELTGDDTPERSITKKKKQPVRVPRWLLGVAGAGVAAAALTVFLMMTGVIRFRMDAGESHLEKNMVRVPNVINKDADQAERIVTREGLALVRDKAVFSGEIPENMVCYQEIRENTPVEKYTSLVVWISKGEERKSLPFVKGLSREEAEKLLADEGFTNIQVKESMEEGVYNSVLDISEEQGTQVALSRNLVITVCVNQKGQEGDSTRQVLIPDLSGMTQEEASEVLKTDGFQVNLVEEFSKEPEKTVIRQNPEAGKKVNKGVYVTLYISKGQEKVYMENVLLMTEAQARQTIEAQGLKIKDARSEYHDSIPAGKVISQSIPANQQVEKGTQVSLVISKGKDSVKEAEEKARREAEKASEEEKAQKQIEDIAREQENMQAQLQAELQAQLQASAAEEARKQSEAEAAEAQRQAEAAAAEEARRQSEAEAAEAQRQAEAAAAEEARRQSEAAAAEAQRQAEAAAEEARKQSEAATAGDNSDVVTASGKKTTSKKMDMDNLKGRTLEEASEMLADDGLQLGSVSREYSDTVEEGCVISQSVAPGKTVKKGDRINLTVSKGPAP